ncbi:MAG: CPBP family intramembrane metalloprotease [Prevotella sp.]|nr:CPBP family intramembrane metalloprotease [Prevotella sp.]
MKSFINVITYLVAFLLLQTLATMLVAAGWVLYQGEPLKTALQSSLDHLQNFNGQSMIFIIASACASLLTIVVFLLARWSPFSRTYIRTRPWTALTWIVLLGCGTIIPSIWLQEKLGAELPPEMLKMLEYVMKHPAGYLVLAILAPLAEEMVFRGAILRELLGRFHRQWHWIPILISALLFGAVHGNLAQFFHATLLGLLLGWMYYRTDSIVPGLVLHWVNNTIVYVATNLLPQASGSTLLELFGGNQRAVWLALGCSMCIFLPSLFQVALRLRKSRP